mgnify:CR=1 FL=1|jgi:hypothetical protein
MESMASECSKVGVNGMNTTPSRTELQRGVRPCNGGFNSLPLPGFISGFPILRTCTAIE